MRTSDDQRNGLEQVWESEQREARVKSEESAAKQKKVLEAELKSAQDRLNHQNLELEKAWAMNAELVICVRCTLRHESANNALQYTKDLHALNSLRDFQAGRSGFLKG
jgi:hypothetical protein